jgi:hypothetical protein
VGFPVPLEKCGAVRQLEIDTARACLILKRVLVRVGTLFTAEPPHHLRGVHHGRTGTMPQARRPDESVPSIPQRRACSVFNSGVDRHFRFVISASLPARGDAACVQARLSRVTRSEHSHHNSVAGGSAYCTWPDETLLGNSPRPKIYALGARFIHGIYRVLVSFDCRLQGRMLKRF